jgi:cytidyltransferase-like protein
MTKIISLKDLISQLDHNQTIVLITGIFDILHSEHKKFLQAAKKQAHTLIVGLESDARVKQLKGLNRPTNFLKTRLQNLTKWGIADYIFPLPEKFHQPHHHQALIKQIKPNILAISSHTPNQPQKKRIIEKHGGQLKIVHPHNPKISSTKLINPA